MWVTAMEGSLEMKALYTVHALWPVRGRAEVTQSAEPETLEYAVFLPLGLPRHVESRDTQCHQVYNCRTLKKLTNAQKGKICFMASRM